MIGAAGAVAVGGALTPVVFAATNGEDSASGTTVSSSGTDGTEPQKFPATRTEAATGTTEAKAAFAISYVGVRWGGAADGAGIRFADGASAPGKWQELSGGCATVEDGGTALVAAGTPPRTS